MKAFIRLGDKTSHGGTVVEGFPTTRISGRPMAGMFHKVTCPKCGDNYIAEGDPSMTVDGRHPARDGHKTACGATLISSQSTTLIDAPGGTGIGAAPTATPAAAWAAAAQPAPKESASDDDDTEVVEQYFQLLEDGKIPADDYHYDLFKDDQQLAKAASYSGGKTMTVPGQAALKLVTWQFKDAASKV